MNSVFTNKKKIKEKERGQRKRLLVSGQFGGWAIYN